MTMIEGMQRAAQYGWNNNEEGRAVMSRRSHGFSGIDASYVSVRQAMEMPSFDPAQAPFVTAQEHMRIVSNRVSTLAMAQAHETKHVGLLQALDLPSAYKDQRLTNDFSVSRNNPAVRAVVAKLERDPQALAELQGRANEGLASAREMVAQGMTKAQAFESDPALAERYASDVAFREGFDAGVATTKPSMPQSPMPYGVRV